jgi:hypothetical protein
MEGRHVRIANCTKAMHVSLKMASDARDHCDNRSCQAGPVITRVLPGGVPAVAYMRQLIRPSRTY